MNVIIIHNRIPPDAAPDEADVLSQVQLVLNNLIPAGHQVSIMDIGENLFGDIDRIRKEEPDIVFNLVESVFGKNELLYIVPAMLEAFRITYTGAPAESLLLTTNKVTAKKIMKQAGIPTPEWFYDQDYKLLDKKKKYIRKPVREDGSVDLDEDAVFKPADPILTGSTESPETNRFFVEEFIDGREFNISLLADQTAPEVLPQAEIVFQNFPPDKEKIVGYRAKWDQKTFEYGNTVRKFNTLNKENELSDKMSKITLQCWEVFGLKGYARVDFRVDQFDNPYVLEINANPCISPDSGFIAAAREAGHTQEDVIQRILTDIN
ncbi:MAG: ATP-grasp domain-containing protein [Cyclobacteriaceae bacterium]|nr:ATP-grasp domain-containing protein [Cyclobacteriaceae bacterium]